MKTKNGYSIEIDSAVSKDIKGVMKNTIVPTEQSNLLLIHGLEETLGIEKSVIKIPIVNTHKPKNR